MEHKTLIVKKRKEAVKRQVLRILAERNASMTTNQLMHLVKSRYLPAVLLELRREGKISKKTGIGVGDRISVMYSVAKSRHRV